MESFLLDCFRPGDTNTSFFCTTWYLPRSPKSLIFFLNKKEKLFFDDVPRGKNERFNIFA
ncbi:hypothetical protein EBR78_10660 [bacterium]|nr:hypothetical protein [bacterium]